MNDQTDEIKGKIDIVEYIGQRVQLKKAGRNFKGLCPFHQEKTPSFVVSADRQIWHCFGTCGVGGDVISFLMKWDNLTFYEALQELAEMTGIVLENGSFNDTKWDKKEKLYAINESARKYYQYLLEKTKFGIKAREYLKNRTLNERIIKTFELGYAPSSWDSLLKYLQKKNFAFQDIVDSGLIIMKDQSRGYDRFRNRVMFPLRDARGKVIGFSGRLLEEDAHSAKYVNTPETEVYHKRDHLYGIDKTKEAIRKSDNAIVVEGEFDLITPYQYDVENIVAIKGAALTEGQLNILKRYTKRLTLALDTDAAGIEAMKRGIVVAEKMDFEIHIVEFSKGKDPDEAIRADKVQFLKDVKKARPIYDFLINSAKKKYPEDSSSHKKKIGDEVAPFIRLINNPIVRSHYVRALASILDVQEESVEKLLRNQDFKTKTTYASKKKSTSNISRKELMQKYILSFLLQHKNPAELLKFDTKVLEPEYFKIPSYASIFEKLIQYLDVQKQEFDYAQFAKLLPAQTLSVADELFLFASDLPDMNDKNFVKLSTELAISELKQNVHDLLSTTEETDDVRLSALSEKLKRMEKTFQAL
ncbi:DNA primase [Candidatus Roizmanbacteria bacterium CG_4_9_14_0_2_um_filter_39_13]|uniref:DNA primase n=1 Tax=Candidatus Roizmanbacteria bacterium CG_4_9_14_0_2_um_filter_39_13 TaxID=1974839 RepID=A0A2M8F0M6_9BACT|nr:MAG: DNA primase [Candidatus Roizmanbacteria bacterium CG_4_10_14_0_2_um_filter_39_12]PJC32839.1 MAG: DNA primase [Candidatus Roizmanbacteria bacterium CG_4_9_14_0_2_um_filter_39_13]